MRIVIICGLFSLLLGLGCAPTLTKKSTDGKAYGAFVDPRDSQLYRTVELDGKVWLAENLRFQATDSWPYEAILANERTFGRLYTWHAAQTACPKGWHLPSRSEWKALSMAMGGYYDAYERKAYGDAKKAFNAMIMGGSSGFDGLLSGFRFPEGEYSSMGRAAYFWGSEEVSEHEAFNLVLLGGEGETLHFNTLIDDKMAGFACRCVKN